MSPRPGLNLGVWRTELVDDADREFLLSGLKNGFDIVDSGVQVVPVEVENHPSARPGSPYYPAVKQQVLHEISEGNYIVCDGKPNFVSPLGAIPKSSGGIQKTTMEMHQSDFTQAACSFPTNPCINQVTV